jgi:hypothetical protein
MRWILVTMLAMTACGEGVGTDPGKTCENGEKGGNETDIDCGGGTCGACGVGASCEAGPDCGSGICMGHVCIAPPAQCTDGTRSGFETDVDCGGGSCAACALGKNCETSADCASATCTGHKCTAPVAECLDNVRNGSETDVDCGGGNCPACAKGKACVSAADCVTGSCINHLCVAPTPQCLDNMKDGDESDVDCGGGTCPVCPNGRMCKTPADCNSGSCIGGTCSSPPSQCLNNKKDANETDVDCGGGICPPCINTKACNVAGDCASGVCANHVCSSPTSECLDNVKNGVETDVDCGGGTCQACGNGRACAENTDCTSGMCNASHVCAAAAACKVDCEAFSGCACSTTCNGHYYSIQCLSGPCQCFDGETMTGTATFEGCTSSQIFNAYSNPSSGCGFPGTLGMFDMGG